MPQLLVDDENIVDENVEKKFRNKHRCVCVCEKPQPNYIVFPDTIHQETLKELE